MPLFRTNRRAAPDPPAQARAETIARETSDAFAAERRGPLPDEGLVAFCLRPQVMLGRLSRDEIDLAGSTIASRLRQEDGFDLRADGAFIVVLANTDRGTAQIVARRLANEITRRSAAVNQRKWVAETVEDRGDAPREAPSAEAAPRA